MQPRRDARQCLIRVADHSFQPLADGALYWPAEQTLIVADLHLEKGSSFARSGQLLPPYDSLTTLARLIAACASLRPRTLILLGDSLHDKGAADRLPEAAWQSLHQLGSITEMIWISGNHDPEADARLPGRCVDSIDVSGIIFRHIPDPNAQSPEIAGHFHPVARIATNIGGARRKAFASDGRRLILPAYGAYTGGLNVLAPELLKLFDSSKLVAGMCGDTGVFPVGADKLVPDSRTAQPVRA
jgi:uncharacterized protein